MRTLLLAALTAWSAAPATGAPFTHGPLDSVLAAFVDSAGRVDYAALKAGRAPLDAYVDSLGGTSPHRHPERFPDRAHELAYWINGYNAFVLQGVVDAYPVASVLEIEADHGFFRRRAFIAGGQALTLDQIQNEIVRPVYREPRIHFALNCAAAGCPPLARVAYRGEDLEAQLEQALTRFAQDPAHVRLGADGRVHLSRLLEWYGRDFVEWFPAGRAHRPARPTVLDYLLPYLAQPLTEYLRARPELPVAYEEYDWALNEQPAPD